MSKQPNHSPHQVIVTRPSPYGEELCGELEAQNFITAHTPLIRFEADAHFDAEQGFETLNRANTWIFVSRQAVNYCFEVFNSEQLDQLTKISRTKTVIAVGSATADSLAQHKISALVPETPNSEGMIALLDQQQLQNSPAALIRGNQGRKLLEDYFEQGDLTLLSVYRRIAIEQNISTATLTETPTAIIVTSGQLMELVAKQLVSDATKNKVTIIAGSDRINKMAHHMGFANCYTAKDATNLELVKSCILWRNNVS